MADAKRRLAAILSADAAGYSRLMAADEEGTIAALEKCRAEFHRCIAERGGRVVDTAGDSVLAVFDSVVEAVRCTVELQDAVAECSAGMPEDRQMMFRLGFHLGDVIEKPDGTVYGDGVNVAARLQSLADPGATMISSAVHDHVEGKLTFGFVFTGEHQVKNIARPVRAYRIDATEAHESPAAAKVEPAAEQADKPSIAVLPLANMSSDPEQEFFADGLTEDIITELSRFRDILVISRNSAFVFKGKTFKVQDAARDLGAQYVLEGSVRKAGDRVRVTVQLIDAESDRHIWADRFDRQLADIFAIQDEITTAIVATLPGRIAEATYERAARKRPENMAAYEYVLTGKRLHHMSTPETNGKALDFLDRAIALDPNYAHAHAWKACTLGQQWSNGWSEDRETTWADTVRELRLALALDDNDSDVHRILAAVHLIGRDYDKAVYHQQRALSLNPNDDLIVVQNGELLTWMGQPEEGVEWIRKAMRLNPYHPQRYWSHLGRAHFTARRYADALEAFKRVSAPDAAVHAYIAACEALGGDMEQAEMHARQVLAQAPALTVSSHLDSVHYQHTGDRDHLRDGLLKAGLPEGS